MVGALVLRWARPQRLRSVRTVYMISAPRLKQFVSAVVCLEIPRYFFEEFHDAILFDRGTGRRVPGGGVGAWRVPEVVEGGGCESADHAGEAHVDVRLRRSDQA